VWIDADVDGPVQQGDLGTGLLDADRGRSAVEAIMDVVRRAAPGTSVGRPPARARPDLCVLADGSAPDPTRLVVLHRDRIAHLTVRLRDGTGVVGPLVLPGRTACLGCVELHRCARDPGWSSVTAQLVGRPGRGGAAAAAATAALGVAQVLAALDVAGGGGSAAPPVLGAALELDPTSGELLRRPWPVHPDCTCGAPPSLQTCESPDDRGTIMG
jgi:bacteriocin biosynthesis cyclodehydratase domain-containing protein